MQDFSTFFVTYTTPALAGGLAPPPPQKYRPPHSTTCAQCKVNGRSPCVGTRRAAPQARGALQSPAAGSQRIQCAQRAGERAARRALFPSQAGMRPLLGPWPHPSPVQRPRPWKKPHQRVMAPSSRRCRPASRQLRHQPYTSRETYVAARWRADFAE